MKKTIKKLTTAASGLLLLLTAALPAVITGCNDSSEVGSVLVGDEITIVVDSSFTISGHSVESGPVLSRTIVQLMGVVDVPEYGYIHSDVVTQFMPSNSIDTAGITVADIDSLNLIMLVDRSSYVGDTLALMGMEVYPLVKKLTAPIFSDFNPEGYYDASKPMGSLVYNLTKEAEPDSLQDVEHITLSIRLPLELGQRFFNEYVTNPATFASPTAFASFFPGIYIKNTYGSGRITRIGSTSMQMYYHRHYVNSQGNDTTVYYRGNYFAVTPEIVTNNDITLRISDKIYNRIDQGEAILLAPAGLNVEMQFPAAQIIDAYNRGVRGSLGVVNSLSMKLPVETIENNYNIKAPQEVLLLLKKDAETFFIENKLPDNVTSFTAQLVTLADNTNAYVFGDMTQYILDLMKKDTITADDVTFVLVPITINTETSNDYYGGSTTVTSIIPYITEPKMVRIMFEKAKINFVYSKQTANIY